MGLKRARKMPARIFKNVKSHVKEVDRENAVCDVCVCVVNKKRK